MRKPPSGGRSPCAGFTLTEAIISMTLSVLLLGGMTVLYYGAAKTVHREEVRNESTEIARMFQNSLTKDLTLVGLWATEDIDGDSNDIDTDVPGMTWTDSLFEAFEYCNTYGVMFTADIDNDSVTEAIHLYTNDDDEMSVWERVYKWDSDSTGWVHQYADQIALGIEHLMIRYYDNEGNELPDGITPGYYPPEGYTLTRGERSRVTAVELIAVTRSDQTRNGHRAYYFAPDGWMVADTYEHTIQSFMVRGRNLRLDS
jgi:hypothetical protein